MGTIIDLTIAGITIDAAKNGMGADHGVLFQEGDRCRRNSEQIDYEYYRNTREETDLAEHEAALARPLRKVLPRLDFLGHTLEGARAEYEALISEEMDRSDGDFLGFDEFCRYACRRVLGSLGRAVDFDNDHVHRSAFPEDEHAQARLPFNERADTYWSEASYFGASTCILSPYSMLQVFGTNAANLDAEVCWLFGPLAHSGWVDGSSFAAGVPRTRRILIATEGTSDARILRHALGLLKPDISDFFTFIDVDEGHPFPGTGSLLNFAKGLVSIDIQNQIIFLLDNDAEGVDANQKIRKLSMPGNMRALLLPDLDVLRQVQTKGPQGISTSDINGKAAAIECYLDLRLPGRAPAQVLWSNYKKDIDAWHGALEYKTTYVEPFLRLTRDNLPSSGYDTSKIEAVLQKLVAEATALVTGLSHQLSTEP